MRIQFCAVATAFCLLRAASLRLPAAAVNSSWADWIEPESPFFSSALDARHAGPCFPANNVTPRGLILNLGRDCWVGFDTDLLRVAAMWRGKGVTPIARAPASYHVPWKAPGGQFPAPEPIGKVWLANGIYPGWQSGTRPSLDDPREPAPSPEEVGRGPLPEAMGRLKAVRLVRGGAVLEYTVDGVDVHEWMTASEHHNRLAMERHFQVAPSSHPLLLVLGFNSNDTAISLASGNGASPILETETVSIVGPEENVAVGDAAKGNATQARIQPSTGAVRRVTSVRADLWTVRIPAHPKAVEFCAAVFERSPAAYAPEFTPRAIPTQAPAPRWPQEVITHVNRSTAKDSYVVDEIELPLENPWRRNARFCDIQFLKDGTGVGVTIDGDVWLIHGLNNPTGEVHWKRFASGLHEPLTVAIRDEQIYVFDRNGIWRLRDTNGDGEADVHELFSNAFAQTVDLHEFPTGLRVAPGGEFVIAKGGLQEGTLGKHNGSVLRISADGRLATVLGYGFRMPFIGVNPRTGLVVASDQQGEYVPTSPLYIVQDRQFYGYLTDLQPREVYPATIADPLTWIPYGVDASALSLVWLFGAHMGPLNDELVHIGWARPEIFRVLLNNRSAKPQAAVVSITRAFDFAPLNGSVNPADGQLYIAGFKLAGFATTATRECGMARVRYTGAVCTLPREVVPMDKGLLLRFDVALDAAKAADPASYTLASWHYQRTYKYGSPQYKADGTPGMDWLIASSAYLSIDGRSVFVGVPKMKPVMQMRLGWSLLTADGQNFEQNAYFTPYDLPKFDPQAEGFSDVIVDLSPRVPVAKGASPVSAEEGSRLYQLYGCAVCHSIDRSALTRVGPGWAGLYGRERKFSNGPAPLIADEAYLRESILEPGAKLVAGYEHSDVAMPSYSGALTDAQIASLILFIRSLKE